MIVKTIVNPMNRFTALVCTKRHHPQPRAWLLTCDSIDWTGVCTRRDYTNCHKLHEIDPISIFSASMHMLSLT